MKRPRTHLKARERSMRKPASRVENLETRSMKHMLRAAVFLLGASFLDNELLRHKCGEINFGDLAVKHAKINSWIAFSCEIIKEFTPNMKSVPEITVRMKGDLKSNLGTLKN